MSAHQITHRDPVELKLHPAAKQIPQRRSDDPDYEALVDHIRARGILQPLLIDAEGRIIEGCDRWRAAKQLQLPTVPCLTVADDPLDVIIAANVLRKNRSKSQLAYIVAPFLDDAFAEAKRRMLAGGNPPKTFGRVPKTPDDWGKSVGVSVEYLRQARELQAVFVEDTKKRTMTDQDGVTEQGVTLRDFYEPRLLRAEKPYRLGAVLAGIASVREQERAGKHKGGKPKESSRQLELFVAAFDTLSKRFEYWQSFSPAEKTLAAKGIAHSLESMPDDLLAELDREIKAERQRRKAQ